MKDNRLGVVQTQQKIITNLQQSGKTGLKPATLNRWFGIFEGKKGKKCSKRV